MAASIHKQIRKAAYEGDMTDQTMIERVARAIALGEGEDYMEDCARFDRSAKSALTAMRKPTEAMMSAAAYGSDVPVDSPATRQATLEPWRAMIDAALAEEG